MQTPDGDMVYGDRDALERLRSELEESTGKTYPIFEEGEVVNLKGGKWRVQKIMSRGRMMLKAVPY